MLAWMSHTNFTVPGLRSTSVIVWVFGPVFRSVLPEPVSDWVPLKSTLCCTPFSWFSYRTFRRVPVTVMQSGSKSKFLVTTVMVPLVAAAHFAEAPDPLSGEAAIEPPDEQPAPTVTARARPAAVPANRRRIEARTSRPGIGEGCRSSVTTDNRSDAGVGSEVRSDAAREGE